MGFKIEVVKTWATVYFTATHNKAKATVELTLNYQDKTWSLCTECEESVSFKDDSFDEAKAKIKAIQAAVNYSELELKHYKDGV